MNFDGDTTGVELPNRRGRISGTAQLIALDRNGSRSDTPTELPLGEIEEAPNLFQPRLDSIAYAPGRSEAHVAALKKTLRQGLPLDPVWVVAFGNDWFLIDGHHRLQAYRLANWEGPIPVSVLSSNLRGQERVRWATEMTFAENKKNRLAISDADKSDGAWYEVITGNLSKSATAQKYNVAETTVANMRRVKKDLLALDCTEKHIRLFRWQDAKNELAQRQGEAGNHTDGDFADKRQRALARRLKSPMDLNPSPAQLAAALEAYSPGIIAEMAIAHALEHGDD